MNRFRLLLFLIACIMLLSACQAAAAQPGNTPAATTQSASAPSLVEQAALEATRIVQQAQATALVLQAQAQAAALVSQAGIATPAAEQPSAIQPAETPANNPAASAPASAQPQATQVPVEVTSVGFAAEGGMIIVRFLAPAKEAAKWWQGSVQVIQESSQQVYEQIPVMPIIGPLIGRPKQDGQAGYVMLYHDPALLKEGDLLTVTLGNYKFEHIIFNK